MRRARTKLRHPIRAIREPFGTAGLIVACIALIAALGGTALAAKGALTGKQKKEVEKIAKRFAGKPGSTGPQGPVGSAGVKGDNGTNGTNGTNGVNAEATLFSGSKGTCTEGQGGVEVKSAKPTTYLCNGKEGEAGAIHPGETLPSGASETGSFAYNGTATELLGFSISDGLAPVSFPIPLAAAPTHVYLIGIGEGEGEGNENAAIAAEECEGTAATPGAANGNLCLFLNLAQNVDLNVNGQGEPQLSFEHTFALTPCEFNEGACKTGTLLAVHPANGANPMIAGGTWAVTAE